MKWSEWVHGAPRGEGETVSDGRASERAHGRRPQRPKGRLAVGGGRWARDDGDDGRWLVGKTMDDKWQTARRRTLGRREMHTRTHAHSHTRATHAHTPLLHTRPRRTHAHFAPRTSHAGISPPHHPRLLRHSPSRTDCRRRLTVQAAAHTNAYKDTREPALSAWSPSSIDPPSCPSPASYFYPPFSHRPSFLGLDLGPCCPSITHHPPPATPLTHSHYTPHTPHTPLHTSHTPLYTPPCHRLAARMPTRTRASSRQTSSGGAGRRHR